MITILNLFNSFFNGQNYNIVQIVLDKLWSFYPNNIKGFTICYFKTVLIDFCYIFIRITSYLITQYGCLLIFVQILEMFFQAIRYLQS